MRVGGDLANASGLLWSAISSLKVWLAPGVVSAFAGALPVYKRQVLVASTSRVKRSRCARGESNSGTCCLELFGCARFSICQSNSVHTERWTSTSDESVPQVGNLERIGVPAVGNTYHPVQVGVRFQI